MHQLTAASPPPPKGLPLFSLEDLAYAYPDGTRALDGVSLAIHHGDRLALVGHNGSGKTTLTKILAGLLAPAGGRLTYKGEEVTDGNRHRLRSQVGILFQDPDDMLFCNTLFEDVAFGPMNQGLPRELVEERVRDALARVELDALAYKAPHNLSYGQRKRAALAAVLAMAPEILVLDEPTANLDPRQVGLFAELLADFPGTVICVNHDLFFLERICHRAVVLASGRVHHDYAFADLMAHPASLRQHGLDFSFRLTCCTDHADTDGACCDPPPAAATPPAQQPEKPEQPDTPPIIELEHCSYTYPDGSRALTDVNLTVRRGERIALVGENGAGKSTLAAALLGIIEPAGRYRFAGATVGPNTRRQLWRRLGMVFQDSADQLFCPSVAEEVAFGVRRLGYTGKELEQRVAGALERVHLAGFEDRVPLNLSGGERKRLAIAAVLAMEPQVLILDEPTAGLDPSGEEQLLAVLADLPLTTILITHDLFFLAALSQRAVVIHRGRLVADMATDGFLADDHLQESLGLAYTFDARAHHRH